MIKQKALAKLTLSLRINEKRDDGFNNLEALTVFLEDIYDEIELKKTDTNNLSIQMQQNDAYILESDDNNLVMKALKSFNTTLIKNHGITNLASFAIDLKKTIPVQGGLGGGSADAAATLRALNDFYGDVLSESELLEIASKIGSDVSACLSSKSCWMRKRGDEITPVELELDDLYALIVTPNIYCSTPAVFRHYDKISRPKDIGYQAPIHLEKFIPTIHNDLSIAAYDLYPELLDFKNDIETKTGLNFQLAGSGATLFGIGDSDKINECVVAINQIDKKRFCYTSKLT